MGDVVSLDSSSGRVDAFVSDWLGKLPEVPEYVVGLLERNCPSVAKPQTQFGAAGSRHNDLLSLAASLRARGVATEAIRKFVTEFNNTLPEPLPERELNDILDWSDSRSELSDYPNVSNLPLSEYLASQLEPEIRWVSSGTYRVFEEGRWKDDPDSVRTRALVVGIIRKLVLELKKFAQLEQDKDTLKEVYSRISKLENFKQVSVLELFKAENTIFTEESDWNERGLLALKNGVYDLNKNEFQSLDPSLLLSKQANALYDPDATAPKTLQFLSEIQDVESAEFILQLFAKSLIGDPFSQHFFVFVGTGANGKSVLVELFKWLLGDYAVSLPAHTLTERTKSGPSEELCALQGSLLSLFPELPSGAVLNASMIKSFTGGDTLFTRRLYGHGFQFTSYATPIMTSNFLPVLDGGDGGMKRRVVLIPFKTVIPEHNRNPNLLNELKQEGAGILNELLARIQTIRSQGLVIPDKIRAQTSAFVDTSNLIRRFADEKLTWSNNKNTSGESLYSRYRIWASMNGYKPFSRNIFENAFTSAFPDAVKKRTSAGMVWVGIEVSDRRPSDVGYGKF